MAHLEISHEKNEDNISNTAYLPCEGLAPNQRIHQLTVKLIQFISNTKKKYIMIVNIIN